MATNDAFQAKRAESLEYEIAVSNWLQHVRGFHVLPTYDYNGSAGDKAPRMTCVRRGLIVPDLLAANDGKFRWFEIKLKDHADEYRIKRVMETGMPLRHFHHYLDIQRITGAPVWVFFIHRAENEVRMGNVEVLNRNISHIYSGDKMDRGGTIFFPYYRLPLLMSKTELDTYRRPKAS